jgi:hypothetical protein
MWQYYQFKDAAQQVVLFGQRADPEEIRANIVAKATELSVPVRPDDVKVSRDAQHLIAHIDQALQRTAVKVRIHRALRELRASFGETESWHLSPRPGGAGGENP